MPRFLNTLVIQLRLKIGTALASFNASLTFSLGLLTVIFKMLPTLIGDSLILTPNFFFWVCMFVLISLKTSFTIK